MSVAPHLIYGMKCVGIVHTLKLGRQGFKDFQDVLYLIFCKRTQRKQLGLKQPKMPHLAKIKSSPPYAVSANSSSSSVIDFDSCEPDYGQRKVNIVKSNV